MNRYCTILSTTTFIYGLQMIRSLQSMQRSAYVYVLAFDDECASLLQKLKLANVKVLTLSQIESPMLLQAKADRSPLEYQWTLIPNLLMYILHNFAVDAVTYVDSKVAFYHNPTLVFKQAEESVILLVPCRAQALFDKTQEQGKYHTAFIHFKRHPIAVKALQWWQDRCLDWCYDRFEEDKYGAQKYLDCLPAKFPKVGFCRHLGMMLSASNIQEYQLRKEASRSVFFYQGHRIVPLCFLFEGLHFYGEQSVQFSSHWVPDPMRRFFYIPYVKQLLALNRELSDYSHDKNLLGREYIQSGVKDKLNQVLGRVPRRYRIKELV